MARFGLLLGIGLLAGCHPQTVSPSLRPMPAQLPTMPRGKIEPDVSAANVTPTALPSARPTQYRKLTAAECRTLAVQNAPLADDLDSHPDNKPSHSHPTKRQCEEAQVSRLVRGYAADDQRNSAAGDALELYYKLVTAEGQFDQTSTAHGILQTQLALAEKAIKAGAADRADVERIRRQLLELESQFAKLEAGIASLNAGLAGHLGLDPADQTPIWPADTLTLSAEVPDVEKSVQTALRCRPDLNLLRTLATHDSGGALAKAVVTGINPLLGTKESANPLFAPMIAFMTTVKREPTQSEAKLQRQVLAALTARERQADAEVRAAVAMVRGNQLAVAAKSAEVRNWQARVAEAEKRAAAGLAGAEAELAVAKVELLKARGELIQAVAEYQISDVKLRRAMGILVRE